MRNAPLDDACWLVFDVGNSALKGALMQGERIHRAFQLPHEPGASPPIRTWNATLEDHLAGAPPVARVGLASVVPPLTQPLAEMLEARTGIPPLLVHPHLHVPFDLAYETPETLGADRLALAAGAWTRYGTTPDGRPRPVLALDAGTAITYEVIDQHGVYLGGAIAAGPRVVSAALHRGTAQLPDVPLTLPDSPIGRSTTSALQSGIMVSFLEGTRGMIERIRSALGAAPCIVVTGGWSSLLKEHIDAIDAVDPHLVLHGIHRLMVLNP